MQIAAKKTELKEKSENSDYQISESDKKMLEPKQIDQRVRYLKVDISMDEHNDSIQKFDNDGSKGHSGVDTIYHI